MNASNFNRRWFLVLASAAFFALAVSGTGVVRMLSVDTLFAAPQDPTDPAAGRGAGGGRQGAGGGAPAAPRPYPQVVTAAAQTSEGIFKVHRITTAANDQLLFEIPKKELDKDFLINSQIKRNAAGSGGYGGQQIGTRVVRWSMKGDRVLLLNMDYSVVADPMNPLMADANMPAIIRTFPVAAYAPSGDPVIDVTTLFTTDVPELSGRGGGGGGGGGGRGMDPTRTFLERVVAFPLNINVEITQTSSAAAGGAGAAAPAPGGGRGGGGRDRARRSSSRTAW